ncbi:DNA-binding FadR family transcriptional regulator [Rhizobium azooxidifex]|uniref:DNA-binding FadR family transcriptional regulator n=1 Tax=Mycoplana azooxidifex TaxID=1636188 RepID=A0A7W6GLY8_9HYPH|nr:hypothetical protein [Mycoplana azooxidifex]MBB3978394.1 DNA-binding FadR family transcriptional regulator [Mycoplana azooxidifex]
MEIEKHSLVVLAAQQLLEMIIGAKLRPCLRLPEQDLSDKMKVAREEV